ncbi:hypothetical protein FKM82_017429 [Ascaphus truei]
MLTGLLPLQLCFPFHSLSLLSLFWWNRYGDLKLLERLLTEGWSEVVHSTGYIDRKLQVRKLVLQVRKLVLLVERSLNGDSGLADLFNACHCSFPFYGYHWEVFGILYN